jgi:hypothetical protein
MSRVPRDKNFRNVPTDKPTADREAVRAPEEWLGGYYVVDHSPCGVANLPNTLGDTWGWMNNRADWEKQNFVFADGDVWASDFQSASDHYPANYVPAGFDGVESVVVGFIASHGVTSGNVFTLSAGGTAHGGCTVTSSDMSLGENELRYMFFSTCQSLKNGNPGNVWFGPARGIRAIFGYDPNIVDSADYGRYFFENWKKAGAKTTYSFLDASWRVSHDQSPVAAWFGPDLATAESLRENEEFFQLGPISNDWIAWRFYARRSLTADIRLSRVKLMTLKYTQPRAPEDATKLVAALVPRRQDVTIETTTVSGDNVCHRTLDGSVMVYNTRSGSIDLTLPTFASSGAVTFTDDDAVAAATDYLRRTQDALRALQVSLPNMSLDLIASDVRHNVAASADRAGKNTEQKLTHITVVFRQTINGIPTIGTGGVLEVTLNSDKEVCRVRSVLREIAAVTDEEATLDVAALQQQAEERALSEVRAEPYVKECKIIKSEFGFFSADESVAQTTTEPSFRVLVEMQTGPFARIIEKIYSARQLAQGGK